MTDPSFPPILIWAIPAFALILAVELAYMMIKRKDLMARHSAQDAVTSVALGFGNVASDILMGAISLGILMWFWQFRLFDLGYSLPIILLAFLVGDFKYYWKHRIFHTMRYWWMSHNVHHSSEHYNIATALRQPWTNHIGLHVIIGIPMVLLGFHPLLVGFAGGLNLLYQYWIHTETIDRLPKWFEAVMNTPSHHRVHHGIDAKYLDANYAGTFIVWDKIFGTFVEEQETPTYGLVHQMETQNPVKVAFREMINIIKDVTQRGISLKQRALYLFGPPGYSHDGSRETVKQIWRREGMNWRMAGKARLDIKPDTELAE